MTKKQTKDASRSKKCFKIDFPDIFGFFQLSLAFCFELLEYDVF